MSSEEFALGGGSMTPVVRVGDSVRRPTGRWSPAVHSLLRHLERVGFEGAPRVLGIDDEGREVLSYLPTEPTWPYSEEALVLAGRLIRRLHDALTTFVPAPGAVWRFPTSGRHAGPGCRIGHNDLGPNNTVFAGGRPYGFIDWDLAGPAGPLDDLALAAINFTPLRPDRFCQGVGFTEPPDRAARLKVFCDAYGLAEPMAFLDAIEEFQQESLRAILEDGAQGVSPYATFLANDEDRFVEWDLEWFRANRPELERALR
jgi:Phosphotransferase enzyme family